MHHAHPSRSTARATWNLVVLATALSVPTLAGCYSTPVMPPTGVLYSNVDAPETVSIVGQELGSRKGDASCSSVLALFAWGDCSGKAAADDGGISKLNHLDYSYLNVLGVYQRLTTTAYGD